MKQCITRQKRGKLFNYYRGETRITDEDEIERINKLAIPPAWKNVEIAVSKKAKIQAKGYDAAGRLQAKYHPDFRLKQEKLKFDRILRFADNLPKLRRQIEKDLKRKRLGKDKVLACIVKLIDDSYFRVGSDQYARDHNTYGVTTLRSKHAEFSGSKNNLNTVTFDFVGKSGQEHVKTIEDKELVSIIKQLDEKPGYEIFRYEDSRGIMHDLHSGDVNAYIKQHMGDEFTAKDFRTWGGTLLATSAAIKDELDDTASETAKKKAITSMIKSVAERLGNTPAIAKSSYVDPRVIAAYEDGITLPKLRQTMASMTPKKYLSVDEQCVLRLLKDGI